MTGSVHAFLRLLRFSNAPTTLADVVAGVALGVAIGGEFSAPRALWAWVLSFAIYEFGMVLNDLADLPADRRQGRARPLVTGELDPRTARTTLVVLGALAALAAAFSPPGTRLVGGVLFLLVVAYDLRAKRHSAAGPLLLGACRALDVLLGGTATTSATAALTSPPFLATLAAYGVYVGALSALARMEDGAVLARRCRQALVAAGAAFLLPGLLSPHLLGTSCHVVGAALILHAALAPRASWSRATVGRTVGRLLRLTVVFGAGVAASAGAPLPVVIGLLLLHPLCRWLARSIPPT